MSSSYNTNTTRRQATNIPQPSQNDESSNSSKRRDEDDDNIITFHLSSPFNVPKTPETAAIRIIKNLKTLALYYATFAWTVLFIALIPRRKVSIVYLVSTTEVAFLYYLLLRAFPNSALLHRVINKRVVLFFLFLAACVELVLTRAAVHLFVVLGASFPLILVHALLSKRDDEKLIGDEGPIQAREYESFV